MTIKAEKGDIKRDEMGRFIVPPKSPGRPKLTEEQRIIKKAIKKWIEDYEQALAEALPEIQPILIAEAKKGNLRAIQEIHKVLGAYKKDSDNTIIASQINFKEDRDEYA